jgi:hypothetical protein
VRERLPQCPPKRLDHQPQDEKHSGRCGKSLRYFDQSPAYLGQHPYDNAQSGASRSQRGDHLHIH